MKPNMITLPVVALIAGLAGFANTYLMSSAAASQQVSMAGQTLIDLSIALESENEKTGRYPDSIKELDVEGSHGDFSAETLDNVHYFRTGAGFVAFVGRTNVINDVLKMLIGNQD